MLKELHIKNFKSHKDTVLNFSKGLNLICGTTQAGKSAILSAFIKLVENRPSGADFYSWFAPDKGEVKIKGVFYDGNVVEQVVKVSRKDKEVKAKSTTYTLNNGKPFEKVGVKVPDKVISTLGLSGVNYQKQSELSFLVNDSATAFSKAINSLTGIEEINFCISEINSKIEDNKREIKLVKDSIKKNKDKLKKIKDLDLISVFEKSARYYLLKFGKESELADGVEDNIVRWESIESRIVPLKKKEKIVRFLVEEIEDKIDSIRIKSDTLNHLVRYISVFNHVSELIYKKRKILSKILTLFKDLGLCPYCFSKIDNNRMVEIEKGLKNV